MSSTDNEKSVEPLVKWSHEQSLSKGILLATAAPAGPVYLSLPLDDWDQDADASALGHLKSRVVDGNPVVPEEALSLLRERLAAAQNPVMVAGPGIGTPAGWDGAVRLAENLSLPVWVAPSPSRCPFPTRHPTYAGILPASIPAVASHFDGHDLIVAFGAPIFMYNEFADGDYLPAGAELWRSPLTRMRLRRHRLPDTRWWARSRRSGPRRCSCRPCSPPGCPPPTMSVAPSRRRCNGWESAAVRPGWPASSVTTRTPR